MLRLLSNQLLFINQFDTCVSERNYSYFKLTNKLKVLTERHYSSIRQAKLHNESGLTRFFAKDEAKLIL